ncbi:hypothetical protein F2P81_023523 [Scophthalmus maximus]|uniref:Uncharacterized protein n=1 Tax=Scophthalmus maximus TaxID=52904 RepID=A0A6A4S0L0_SCOMX|nr:hypothetical protein F2P81_023523 [Scophthalmus maximus]
MSDEPLGRRPCPGEDVPRVKRIPARCPPCGGHTGFKYVMFRVIRKDNYIIFSVPDCNKETNLSVFDLERTLTGSFQRLVRAKCCCFPPILCLLRPSEAKRTSTDLSKGSTDFQPGNPGLP